VLVKFLLGEVPNDSIVRIITIAIIFIIFVFELLFSMLLLLLLCHHSFFFRDDNDGSCCCCIIMNCCDCCFDNIIIYFFNNNNWLFVIWSKIWFWKFLFFFCINIVSYFISISRIYGIRILNIICDVSSNFIVWNFHFIIFPTTLCTNTFSVELFPLLSPVSVFFLLLLLLLSTKPSSFFLRRHRLLLLLSQLLV